MLHYFQPLSPSFMSSFTFDFFAFLYSLMIFKKNPCIYLFSYILLQPLYIAWLLVYSCVTSNHLNLFLCIYLVQNFFFKNPTHHFFCCKLILFWLNLIYYIILLLIFFIMFCFKSNSNLSHYVGPFYFTFIPPAFSPPLFFLGLHMHVCLWNCLSC